MILSGFRRLSCRVARRGWQSLLVVGVTSLCLSFMASLARWPVPSIHDEFSYLLMADTFCEGRLANPTHPAWESLETFHVIHQPSYASKYPPGQGVMLALGQAAFGHPVGGLWLSTALASMAICWMLRGWVTPRWALWGGLLFALQGGLQFVWGQGYWGGNVALLGGALLLGAAPRLLEKPSAVNAIWLSAGLTILANTRPFEGLLISLMVAAWLVSGWWKSRQLLKPALLVRVVMPVCLCLSVTAAAMTHYNQRVTGNPLKMPYKVYEKNYSIATLFVWQDLGKEPRYRHEAMRDFYQDYGLKNRREQTGITGRIRGKQELFRFYATPAFALPMLAVPWIIVNRKYAVALVMLLLMTASTLLVFTSHPHYFAPAAPLIVILGVRGLQYIAVTGRRRGPALRWLAPTVVGLHLVVFGAVFQEFLARPALWGEARARIEDDLASIGSRHLVLVRYADNHCGHEEWVYNRASIDQANIVWARDMGPAANRLTTQRLPDRRVWLLEADRLPRKLVPLDTVSEVEVQQRESAARLSQPESSE